MVHRARARGRWSFDYARCTLVFGCIPLDRIQQRSHGDRIFGECRQPHLIGPEEMRHARASSQKERSCLGTVAFGQEHMQDRPIYSGEIRAAQYRMQRVRSRGSQDRLLASLGHRG